jgi:PleD family two-component response regulator
LVKIKLIEQLNVLIVEGDRHMRMLIREMLFALGVKDVAVASDGKAAVEEMQTFRSDLVLVDLKMEPIGGLEFVRQLRADTKNPYRFVPVIMITAYTDLDTVAMARDVGITEFMAKPISATILQQRIERVLKDSRRFIEAPEFTGPDRRRSKKTALEGKERRETPPKFVDPSEDLPAAPKSPETKL